MVKFFFLVPLVVAVKERLMEVTTWWSSSSWCRRRGASGHGCAAARPSGRREVAVPVDRMRLWEVRPEHIAMMRAQVAGDADEDLLEVDWAPLSAAPAADLSG